MLQPRKLQVNSRRIVCALIATAALIVFAALASGHGAWAATTATVPRETPTRRPTATALVVATATPPPTAAPQPTATSALPSPTAPATTTQEPAATATATATFRASPVAQTPGAALPTVTSMPQVATAVAATGTPSMTQAPAPTAQLPSPTPAGSPAATPLVPPPDAVCVDMSGAPLLVRTADDHAVLDAPAGSMTRSVCIVLEDASGAALPAAPTGYRLSGPVVRLRVTDLSGGALSSFSFAEPVTLSLRIATNDLGATLSVGYVGENSSDWAALRTERDQTAGMARCSTRWPGVYAVLVEQPAVVEKRRLEASDVAWAAAAGFGVLVLVTLLLWMRRRRGRRHG